MLLHLVSLMTHMLTRKLALTLTISVLSFLSIGTGQQTLKAETLLSDDFHPLTAGVPNEDRAREVLDNLLASRAQCCDMPTLTTDVTFEASIVPRFDVIPGIMCLFSLG